MSRGPIGVNRPMNQQSPFNHEQRFRDRQSRNQQCASCPPPGAFSAGDESSRAQSPSRQSRQTSKSSCPPPSAVVPLAGQSTCRDATGTAGAQSCVIQRHSCRDAVDLARAAAHEFVIALQDRQRGPRARAPVKDRTLWGLGPEPYGLTSKVLPDGTVSTNCRHA